MHRKPRALHWEPRALQRKPKALHWEARAMHRKPKALHWEPRAGALGYVVVAFQADWQMCITMSTTYNARSIGVTWLLLWSEWALSLALAASVRRKPLAWA